MTGRRSSWAALSRSAMSMTIRQRLRHSPATVRTTTSLLSRQHQRRHHRLARPRPARSWPQHPLSDTDGLSRRARIATERDVESLSPATVAEPEARAPPVAPMIPVRVRETWRRPIAQAPRAGRTAPILRAERRADRRRRWAPSQSDDPQPRRDRRRGWRRGRLPRIDSGPPVPPAQPRRVEPLLFRADRSTPTWLRPPRTASSPATPPGWPRAPG